MFDQILPTTHIKPETEPQNMAVSVHPKVKLLRFIGTYAMVFSLIAGILIELNLYPVPTQVQAAGVATTNESTVSFGTDTDSAPSLADTVNVSESSNTIAAKPVSTTQAGSVPAIDTGEKPTRVVIDAIGVDIVVRNPVKNDTKTLDDVLLTGVVRYPGSATMKSDGNMFIFGHSSHLPVVYNKNFKAFTDLNKLKVGDEIKVRSALTESIYHVSMVRMDKASDVRVDFASDHKMLTLASCNNFGSKEDRYIVTADFVASYPLGTQ